MWVRTPMTTAVGNLSRGNISAASSRNDLLGQFNAPPPRAPLDGRGAARTFWACFLVAAGMGVGAWLIVLIHAAVFDPHGVALLDRFAPSKPEDLTLTLPAGKVELPPALTPVIAYVFLVLFISVAAKMVAMCVNQGVSLLLAESKGNEAKADPDPTPPAPASTA